MFGYWAFGKHTVGQQGDITTEIKENTVPKSFLYLLIIHFFLILIGKPSLDLTIYYTLGRDLDRVG